MSKITDYSFLFQSMFGTKSNTGIKLIKKVGQKGLD